jgi:hypothetical protein
MTEKDKENNITFFLEEDINTNNTNTNNTNTNIDFILEEMENVEIKPTIYFFDSNFYYEKLTCKELLLICEYYGIAKQIKNNKCKKEEIIYHIISFESEPLHTDTVFQRKNMWFYMNELKNDKIMKKYVLW